MAYIIFVAIFMLICARLYTIASSGSKAETVLSGQYTRRLDIVSRSGFVFDRNGRLLDKISSGYIVSVNPALTNAEEISDILSLVGLDISEYYNLYGKEKIDTAVLYAKDLKDRYSVLWMNYDLMK